MPRRATLLAIGLLVLVGLSGCAGLGSSPEPTATETTAPSTDAATADGTTPTATTTVSTPGSNYETTTVELIDANGTQLATVDVWVADSLPKRYTGLSDTTALEPGQGMLFVHGSEGDRSYVMRDMAFPLDIVFVAADGTITTIHHAPVHDGSGDLKQYSGRARYVLEVPMGYTNRTGVDVGDRVRIEGR
ncbi:DUF192 domain-containing protein [Haloplanus litoreus]|uniref:DUF192 domain-containing protein n=1 Tax=Haloplanus litoreus TaxID=767515 RepID=A0ABD5ZWT8_9EURY